VHTAELVVSLRSFIRSVLDLDPIAADVSILRQGPARPAAVSRTGGKGEGEGKGAGGGGDRGGDAGMAAGTGLGLGIGGGVAAESEPENVEPR
jgi:hypothetical protein